MALMRAVDCLNLVLDFLKEDLRACCHCGWVWEQTLLLCSRCEDRLRSQSGLKVVDFGSYSVISPLNWRVEDTLIESLVYAQKGGLDPKPSQFLADLLLLARWNWRTLPPKAILVPAPASRPGLGSDHALALAQALSRQTGWPLWPFLQRNSLGPRQKALRRDQRRDLKIFSLQEPPGGAVTIILVDDVVTTGGTAAACFQALGRPKNYEVWALAYRDLCY